MSSLHERLGVTTIYVTHDQIEAMTLGTRESVLVFADYNDDRSAAAHSV